MRALLACVAIVVFSCHSFSMRGEAVSVDYESPCTHRLMVTVTPDKGEEFPYFSEATESFSILENGPKGNCQLLMILNATDMNEEGDQDYTVLQTYLQDLIRLALLCEKHYLPHRERLLPSCSSVLILVPSFLAPLDQAEKESSPVNDTLLKALRYENHDLFLEGRGEERQGIPRFEDSPTGLIHAISWMLHHLSPHVLFGWGIPASTCEADEEAVELAVDWPPVQTRKKVFKQAASLIGQGVCEEAKRLTFDWSPARAGKKTRQRATYWIK